MPWSFVVWQGCLYVYIHFGYDYLTKSLINAWLNDLIILQYLLLFQLDPAFRLDAYSERNSIQLKGSKDLDPAKIEEAENIVSNFLVSWAGLRFGVCNKHPPPHHLGQIFCQWARSSPPPKLLYFKCSWKDEYAGTNHPWRKGIHVCLRKSQATPFSK